MKTPEPEFKHKLGITVTDVVTGFEGVITARSQHLHMCNRYDVTPTGTTSDGKLKEVYSFDEDALKVVSAVPIAEVPQPVFKYGLGGKAKDAVTLIEGVVVSRVQYLHLCNRYIIQPQGLTEKGERKSMFGIDESAVVPLVTPELSIPAVKQKDGGPPTRVSRT